MTGVSGVDPSVATVARMWDFYLGGCDNYDADRKAARLVIAAAPHIVDAAAANRAFAHRVIGSAAAHGIQRFLDLGCGLPTLSPTHRVARSWRSRARTLYVDRDLQVVHHARHLLGDDSGAAAVCGDIRDIDAILGHPTTRALFAGGPRVCVLMLGVGHFVAEGLDLVTATLRRRLPSGSLLAISHAVPGAADRSGCDAVKAIYASIGSPLHLRSADQVAALFDGWQIEPADWTRTAQQPVPLHAWRPDIGEPVGHSIDAMTAVVGRIPERGTPAWNPWPARRPRPAEAQHRRRRPRPPTPAIPGTGPTTHSPHRHRKHDQ
ncbi:hypothetical protein Asi02nite_37430 [Asanoa siamensis]|uniref:S-adenosyl methyltransferase n=1 Tax=Asanoa siamensis TaxID=926357 RepID=A0ABQ4CSF7_9ACTN|nr:hypothetical protein Asi02nite_37430 [Asanoa siamensis]